MQEYLRRGRFAAAMDDLGFHFLALIFSLGWFSLLWGLRLPAVTAGLALYGLILLFRRKTRDDRLKRKEKKLRERLGGEMALERLLMLSPAQAHFETAMLLSLQKPMELLRTGKEGVLCLRQEEKTLISFLQLPLSSSVSAEHVLSLQRCAQALGAARGLLCAPCPVSDKAFEQAESLLPVSFLQRDALIRLFGRFGPATDSQLVALGKRRKKNAAPRLLRAVFFRKRARKYAWYGALLLGMYLLTNHMIYALPGLLCVGLAAACRCVHGNEAPF